MYQKTEKFLSFQADNQGCITKLVKTKVFQLRQRWYDMSIRVEATVREEGTGWYCFSIFPHLMCIHQASIPCETNCTLWAHEWCGHSLKNTVFQNRILYAWIAMIEFSQKKTWTLRTQWTQREIMNSNRDSEESSMKTMWCPHYNNWPDSYGTGGILKG